MRKLRVAATVAVLLAGSLALAACSSGGSTTPSPTSSTGAAENVTGTIHIGQFGGSLGDAIMSIKGDFEAKYPGVTVTSENTAAAPLITSLIAQRNQSQGAFDLIMTSAEGHLQLKDAGILQKLDNTKVPALADIPAALKPAGGYAPIGFFTIGIAYNKASLKKAGAPVPKSWDDLWNPAYKGHVILQTFAGAANLNVLLDILWTEEGSLAKAEKKLGTLFPNVGPIVTTQPELETALSAGDPGWLAISNSSRAGLVAASGTPLGYVLPTKPAAGSWVMSLDVPKNAPNKAAAYAFINFLLQPAEQEKISKAGYFSPANPAAKVDPSIADWAISADKAAKLYQPNWQRQVDSQPDIDTWFNQALKSS